MNHERLLRKISDVCLSRIKELANGVHPKKTILDAFVDCLNKGIMKDLDEVVQNTMAVLVGGNENTGAALTAMVYFLTRHPRVADKARSEIFSTLLKNDVGSV